MKYILIIFSFCLSLQLTSQAEWQQIIESKMPADLRMSCDLWQCAKYAEFNEFEARAKLAEQGIEMKNDLVYLEVLKGYDVNDDIEKEYLESLGFTVERMYRNMADVYIPFDRLIEMGATLREPYILKKHNSLSYNNQGPGKTNITAYNNAGKNGQGITVGIIDANWSNLTTAINAGTAPFFNTQRDYMNNGPFENGTNHGTGCAEMVFDYAPNVNYFFYKASSTSQIASAITDAINDGVQILVRSATNFNTGWADGSGTLLATIKTATDAGILWLNGSGNFNGQHWQGSFTDTDGDNIHNWIGTADEGNNILVAAGATLNINLQWAGNPDINNNYDLDLLGPAGNVLLSRTSTTTFESATYVNNTALTQSVRLRIWQAGTVSSQFEVFMRTPARIVQYTNDGSTACPTNSLEPRAITVGVVNQVDYDSINPPLEFFCSKGPTNGGIIVPDLTAPDNCTAISYPGGFSGASAGGPNLAGFLAAFWSEHNYLSQDDLIEVVYKLAENYNDWGDPGMDNSFGHGGIHVPDFKSNSRFIYKAINNVAGSLSRPFLDMPQADQLSSQNSNLYFLGETFSTVNPGSIIIDKPNVYRSAGKDSNIKE